MKAVPRDRKIPTSYGAPRQTLSQLDAMAITVGIVIGAGIFETPALVAANAGSAGAVILVWVLGGVISMIGALCYAELATTYPHPGGNYHYLWRAYGPSLAFLFAWARLAIIQTGSIALMGFVFGDYASRWFSLGEHSAAIYAGVAIVLFTAINVAGLRFGKSTQNLLTTVEISGLLLITVAGFTQPAIAAAAPAAPVSNFGLMMVFVLLTFGGWNEAAFISAEIKGPRRNIARVLISSIAVITIIYVLVNAAFVHGMGLAGTAASKAPAADLLVRVFGTNTAFAVSLIVAASALSSMNATIFTGARTNYALGRDFAALKNVGRWNLGRDAPTDSLILQGAIAFLLVLLGTVTRKGFATMVEYTAPVFWFFFLLTGIALFILRRREPHAERPFRVPLYPLTPLLFCAVCAYLLYSSLVYTGLGAMFGVGVLLAGLPMLYLLRRSRPAEPLPTPVPERLAS
jgi:basic amino acid/polyamine antiporter, APA family